MSSADDKPPVTPPFSIQNIVSKLKQLTKDCEAKVDPPKQTTDGTNTAEADNDDGRKTALHELEKLCKELDYMLRSFQKLEEFEKNLREPLQTLENNVSDILDDLGKPELPKQVHNNLRVLRNNITRVKITIPAQHQTASLNSEGTRGLQATIATGDAGDLPHLYSESKEKDIFAESYYFKEIEEKYESLDIREKLCLLCFAIFPENAVIKKRFLRFWWVGENLVPLKQGQDEKDEKKFVNDTLSRYVEKRLIEPILKKNKLEPRSYKMNPIVRSCLIKFAKQELFFDYDSEGKPIMDFSSRGCNKACMVKSEEGARAPWFSEYLRGSDEDKKTEKSLRGNEDDEDKKTEKSEEQQQGQEKTKEKQQGQENTKEHKLPADLVKLQMLFNFPSRDALTKASKEFDKFEILFNLNKQYPDLPEGWLAKMTGLQVLYLGKWETEAGRPRYIEVDSTHFFKGLENMKKLRLLGLQGISGIPKIPSTLGKLENLRILDLRACHNLEKLPDTIGSLKKLTYLDLSECYLLDCMPKQLNQLSELQVLKGFVIVSARNSCSLIELSKLENLRKLSIAVNTTEFNIDDEGETISKFQKLEKLRIAWGSRGVQKEGSTQGSSSQQQNAGSKWAANVILAAANKLRLPGRERKPKDLKGPEKLVKLDLHCFPHSAPPKWLVPSKMVSLTNLSIRGGRLRYLVHKDETMWNVDTLRLMSLVDFKMNWKETQEHFPKLKYLDIERSPRITFYPCHANGVVLSSSK